MIQIVLAHSDLARVRFAHSPIEELVASLRVLQDPSRQLMYGRWLAATRPRLDGVRLELLTALAPTGRYLPSFLFPPSTQPWGMLADELARVAASPPALVRAELDEVREGHQMFQVITLARPARGLLMGSPFAVTSTSISQSNTRIHRWSNPGGPRGGAFRSSWRADEGDLSMGAQSARRTPT
jgi:Family of unknown function (DUF5937)